MCFGNYIFVCFGFLGMPAAEGLGPQLLIWGLFPNCLWGPKSQLGPKWPSAGAQIVILGTKKFLFGDENSPWGPNGPLAGAQIGFLGPKFSWFWGPKKGLGAQMALWAWGPKMVAW